MYRFLFRLVLLILLVLTTIYFWEKVRKIMEKEDAMSQTSHNIVLKEVVALGKLELVKYHFRDVIEHERIKQFLPNSKALLIVQGEAIGCIDLTQLQLTDLGETADTLIVRLPEPEICSSKIDHSKSKVYNTDFAFTDEALLVDEAFKQAETQVQESAIEMGILSETKANANKILKPLIEKISGKKVVLRYRMNVKLPERR
jgi:Protein of unknown function (DUF4230)